MTQKMSDMFTLAWITLCCAYTFVSGEFNLTILHTNDCHARFMEINKYGGTCKPEDSEAGKCFGGIPRRMTEINRIRNTSPNPVLYLDAGDQYQGTVWFYVYRGRAVSYFTNLQQYDAMALGNHEFDNAVEGLLPFLQNATFPVLSANIDATNEPSMQGLFEKSTVITRQGRSIGIIGYTTKDTPKLSNPGVQLVFHDEVQSITEEVEKLQAQGVDIIIAVGHAGFRVDTRIAEEVAGIDVVVGGHTNTFLYTGESPSIEPPEGEYPHVVTHASRRKTLVVQDYAFGKYLGNLDVTFDDDGEVIAWGGNPILLDSSIEKDADVVQEVLAWQEAVMEFDSEVIGKSHVLLEGRAEICRLRECNLGNVVTDAMVFKHLKYPDEASWANVTMAMVNGGGIRASIEPGTITTGDIAVVWPFGSTIDLVEVKGSTIKECLEHSVAGYDPSEKHGKFLQVAGMQVSYDLSQPEGQRVISLLVRCSDCLVPRLVPYDLDGTYKVIISSYMAAGGDGYDMIASQMINHHIYGDLDVDILLDYFTQMSPIITGLEGRIEFLEEGSTCRTRPSVSSEAALFPHCIVIVVMLMCAGIFVS